MASSPPFIIFLLSFLIPTFCAAALGPPPTPGNSPRSTARTSLSSSSGQPLTKRYFQQQLDHFTFTPNSSRVFLQKYLVGAEHWPGPPHPIFVYTGNEGDIEWFADNTGFMFDIAPEFRALLIFIEHRFYGESKPFGNDSYDSIDTLGYLTSTQALADYAVLIKSLKQNLSAEASPVVVFGGSYGGMLAAWFRLKYPHVAIGALSSSAPILQFDDITPWTSFYDAVSQDFKDESLNCFEVIKGSWDELNDEAAKKGGLEKLSRDFRACKTVDSVDFFENWLWTAFVYTAMVDYPMAANFLMPLPGYPVKEMCKIIDRFPASASRLTRAIAAASLYYNYTGDQACFTVEGGTDPHGLSGWNWQACTEMVMPMSVSNQSMFPPSTFSYSEFASECQTQYQVLPRPHWITTEFGGERIDKVLSRFASNIIFSNGLRDPWSRGGVLKTISPSVVALVTAKGAHHLDLRYATKEDPSWVIEQRRKEVEIIKSWMDQYQYE